MKYRIGEFSKLGKVPITTLRYYDEIGILKPGSVAVNHYRYYDSSQLDLLNDITRYRRAGLSMDDIRGILEGLDPAPIMDERIRSLESEISSLDDSLRLLRELRDGVGSEYSVEVRDIPAITTAYRKGRLDSYSDLTGFVLDFARICGEEQPDIECTEDGECFVLYDDMEYRENDIGIQYHQVVKRAHEPSEGIGFMEFKPVRAACVKHKGPYDRLSEAYASAISW